MIVKLTKETLDWLYQENKEYQERCCENPDYTKFAFITDQVVNLCPYDSEVDDIWGHIICDVLLAIYCRKNFDYQNISNAHYHGYLIVCQLLDKYGWIEWGTSIRSCWLEKTNKARKLFECMCGVDITDKRYDEEGIDFSIENIKTLLEWVYEKELKEDGQ